MVQTKTKKYSGWANYETWNVALWLQNDYPIYHVARSYCAYKTPYLSLRHDLKQSLNYTITKDGVSFWNEKLNIKELDNLIKEMGEY